MSEGIIMSKETTMGSHFILLDHYIIAAMNSGYAETGVLR
jgi:hypothetical protein